MRNLFVNAKKLALSHKAASRLVENPSAGRVEGALEHP